MRTFLFLYLISYFISSSANTSNDLSLSQAVQKTLNANPLLKQQQFIQRKYQLEAHTAQLRPQLNIDIEAENFGGEEVYRGTDSAEMLVALSSVIELGGKRSARENVALAELDAYDLQAQAETLDILGSLTNSFLLCLSIQEEIKIVNEQVDVLNKALETVKRRVEKGASPDADLRQARVSLAISEINLMALQKEYERRRLAIANFWGDTNLNFEKVEGDLFIFKENVPFDQLISLVETSPQMKLLMSKEKIAQVRGKLEQVVSRPSIDWQIGVKHMNDADESALAAGFSIPMFSGKRNRSNQMNAQIDIETLELEKIAMQSDLYRELFILYSQKTQRIETVLRLSTEVIPDLEAAMLAIQDGYENGRYRYSELAAVQAQLIEMKKLRIENAAQALLSQAIFEQLTGFSMSETIKD